MATKNYDLEDRTLKFSEDIISLCKKVKIVILNRNVVDQLLRSATSIGANYYEANGAVSKKDFTNEIYICKKEAKESYCWLCLLEQFTSEDINNLIRTAKKESKELLLIFSKIASSNR